MKSSLFYSTIAAMILAFCSGSALAEGGKRDYDTQSVKLTSKQGKQAALTVLSSELLSRTKGADDVSLVIRISGDRAGFECTGNSAQSIAACEQRCLAIQTELEDTNAPEGGCSSINNGCECTHDPFE